MITKARKVVFICLFLALIFVPALLSLGGVHLGDGLNGAVEAVEKPALSAQAVMEGTWQESVEEWTKSELSVREPLIRLGNQFIFDVFNGTSNNNLVVGKDQSLFEDIYLEVQLQYSHVTEEYMASQLDKLEQLDRLLEARGQQLVIFLTPMKSAFCEDSIPNIWKWAAPEQDTSDYELFRDALASSSLTYYDSIPFVETRQASGEQCWTKTGIHWTSVTGWMVAQDFSDFLEENFGYDFPEWEITSVPCESPVYPDHDLFLNLNLLMEPYDEQYYEPVVTMREEGTNLPAVFSQGGSFQAQSILPLLRNAGVEGFAYVENKEYTVYDGNEETKTGFQAFGDVDMAQLLTDKDLVILEVNQEAIDRMSFGFIDYLLDSGILTQ